MPRTAAWEHVGVSGGHRDPGPLQGALVSGRRAITAILEELA